MRILVLSSVMWSHDNSFGNTFSNFFDGIDDIEVANIVCRPGYPTASVVKCCFLITEKTLLSNLKNPRIPSGVKMPISLDGVVEPYLEDIKGRKFGQKKRWQILFWGRDLIWRLGRWDSPELRKFIDDFAPDLIFQPIYFSSYLNDIAQFIKSYTGLPMIGYLSDDNYTLKQFSLSPLYWCDRLYKRRKVKKTIEQCEILYVISEIQKKECEQSFTTKCKILTKHSDFSVEPSFKTKYGDPLQIVFTGNIGNNRWKSLAMIAKVLEKINYGGIKAQLRIYTTTPLTRRIEKNLNRGMSSFIMGCVSGDMLTKIQRDADLLVHVEAFDIKNKLAVRQSFSTKIVDYMRVARPILAVGPKDVASMDYFIKNECAVVAGSAKELEQKLCNLLVDRHTLDVLAKKSYECGRKNHDKQMMQRMMMNDFWLCCNTSE